MERNTHTIPTIPHGSFCSARVSSLVSCWFCGSFSLLIQLQMKDERSEEWVRELNETRTEPPTNPFAPSVRLSLLTHVTHHSTKSEFLVGLFISFGLITMDLEAWIKPNEIEQETKKEEKCVVVAFVVPCSVLAYIHTALSIETEQANNKATKNTHNIP